MSEIRQKTFGGTWRQFCKDLGDLKHQTSSSSMNEKQNDPEYWQHIRDLETRILDAILAIEVHDYFQHMSTGFWKTRGEDGQKFFHEHWSLFRDLPLRWVDEEHLWPKEYSAKLKEFRNWDGEHKILKTVHDKFDSAKPSLCSLETKSEWKEDDRADASSKRVNGDTREPTFGGAFRKLVGDLRHMIYLKGQGNLHKASQINEWERIRDLEIAVREAVKKLSSDEFLIKMVSGLKRSHDTFMDGWKYLEQLSSEWEKSTSQNNNPAINVDDKKWKKDRDTLIMIDSNIHWAFPLGSIEDNEWKYDYRADPNASQDPLHLTFGQAWKSMKENMKDLERKLNPTNLAIRGQRGDYKYWDEVQEPEERIRDNVPKFPQHPFFKDMYCPRTFHGRDTERSNFMWIWERIEELSQKWRARSDIWNHKNDLHNTRGWEEDAQALKEINLYLHREVPRGFEHDPEWTAAFLPVSRMQKDVEFIVNPYDYTKIVR